MHVSHCGGCRASPGACPQHDPSYVTTGRRALKYAQSNGRGVGRVTLVGWGCSRSGEAARSYLSQMSRLWACERSQADGGRRPVGHGCEAVALARWVGQQWPQWLAREYTSHRRAPRPAAAVGVGRTK